MNYCGAPDAVGSQLYAFVGLSGLFVHSGNAISPRARSSIGNKLA